VVQLLLQVISISMASCVLEIVKQHLIVTVTMSIVWLLFRFCWSWSGELVTLSQRSQNKVMVISDASCCLELQLLCVHQAVTASVA